MITSKNNPNIIILTCSDLASTPPENPKSAREWFKPEVQKFVEEGKYDLILLMSSDNLNKPVDICYVDAEKILETWDLVNVDTKPESAKSKVKKNTNSSTPKLRNEKGHFIKSK